MCTRVSQQSAHRVCQPNQKHLTATYIGLYLYLNLHLSLLDLKDHASDQVSLSLFKMCILIFDIQVKYKTIGTLSLSITWPPCRLSCIRQRCNWNKVQVNTRKWPGVFAQFNMCALLWTTCETHNCGFIYVFLYRLQNQSFACTWPCIVDQIIPNWCLTRWQHRRHFCASHPFLMHCMPVCSVSFVSCVNFLRMLNNVASVNSGLETIDRGDDVGGSANAMQCMLYNVDLRSIMVEHPSWSLTWVDAREISLIIQPLMCPTVIWIPLYSEVLSLDCSFKCVLYLDIWLIQKLTQS